MKYLAKTIEYAVYALAFFLPLQTRLILQPGELNGGYFEYGTYSLYFTDILLITTLLLFLVLQIKNSSSQFPFSNFKFLLLFIFFAFLSIFFAQDKFLAFYIFSRLLLGMGLFWLLLQAEFKKLRLLYFFLAGIFLQASLGIWQFLTQSSFASKWLGMAEHNPADLGVSVIELLSGERWLRAYGGLDHPNILGGVLAIGLLIIFIFLLKIPIYKKQEVNNFQFGFLIFYLLFFTFFLALFFSFSRNAWIAFIVGWITLFSVLVLQKESLRRFLKLSASLGVLAVILFYFYGDLAKTRFLNSSRLENKSVTERINDYKLAKDIIKENWLFGVGIGNYGLALHKLNPDQPSYAYQPVHNSWLLLWAEIGILGVGSLLIFLALFFKRATIEKKYYLFLFLPMAFMMLNEHWFWSLHFGVLFFWFIIGFVLRFSDF